jgi:hypothetical protein
MRFSSSNLWKQVGAVVRWFHHSMCSLLDAQTSRLKTVLTVYWQILTHLTKLAAAERDYSQAFKVIKLILAATAKLLVTFP